MTRALFRRSAGVAAAAAIAALVVGPAPRPAAADPPAPSPALKKVPADAALFVHVDVAAVWNSKLGETIRAAKARDLEKFLREVKTRSGVTPDMIKTVTVFFPQLKQPGDQEAAVFHVAFLKPYDKAKLLDGLKKTAAEDDKVQIKEAEPGVYDVVSERNSGGKKEDEVAFSFALTDPMAITAASRGARKYLKDAPVAADGPLAPAIKAAADGATAVLGLNFANLPDEIRTDDIPAEVRPFQPLFRSDALIATGKLDGDKLRLAVRFRSQEKPKVAEAEKSLAAGLFLAQTALGAGIEQLEKAKEGSDEKALLPLAREAVEVVKAAKVSVEGNEAVVTAAIKTDTQAGALLQTLFGGKTGPAAAADRAKGQNNLKQIALALHNYHDTYEGFPPAALVDKKGKPMLSWRVMILPFVEQDALYKEFHLDEPWDSEHNKKVFEKHPMPKVFEVPGVTKEGEKTTHLQAFVGNGALFDPIQPCKISSITDGTSNTIMVATAAKAVPWTKPDDIPFDPKVDPRTLLLMTGNGCSIAMADGSVRFISKSVAEDVLKAMITKAGGEVIDPDQ
jgi:hypothetical protein